MNIPPFFFRKYRLFAAVFLFNSMMLNGAPEPREANLNDQWKAEWITHPDIKGDEFGVYYFQRDFDLEVVPENFEVQVSADNRYKLYVNGHYVGNGPARGDTYKWRYETIDLAGYLEVGTNLISAVVWNYAEDMPVAQISAQTGFILQGVGEKGSEVNTDERWRVYRDTSYSPLRFDLKAYFVVGPGERMDAEKYPWGWQTLPMKGGEWKGAKTDWVGIPVRAMGAYGAVPGRVLFPRQIPAMERKVQRFASIRRGSTGLDVEGFLKGEGKLKVEGNQKVELLLDQGALTTAYPVLKVTGGKGALIRLTYAESLFYADGTKGNRNEIEGKKIFGFDDEFILDGGEGRRFETLWWRTFRYVRVQIETGQAPLEVEGLHSIFTAYPFEEIAKFEGGNRLLDRIWDVGWHTQRLCAGETFFDCPYYEQLQYVGDTRIQCLVSYYVSGDHRLMKRAVADYNESRLPFGLTQSRYPSNSPQVIAPFSLYWIAMVHDYWMLRPEPEFVRSMLPGVLEVLQWYETRMGADGLLGRMEWWNFVDWIPEWEAGVPPGEQGAGSTVICLEYMYALQLAAELFDAYSMEPKAVHCRELVDRMRRRLKEQCWDASRGLYADTPERKTFSQHANVMAVLVGLEPEKAEGLMEKVMTEEDLSPCSYYYRFYMTEALVKAGMSDQYLKTMRPWEEMLERGLTTFAEQTEPTRSDCHAWSSSPLYHFLSLVGGIRPGSPGFKTVEIAPSLGDLPEVRAQMPHPMGMIRVELKRGTGDSIEGTVELPEGLSGEFYWVGARVALKGGVNRISL